jgi:SOS response regulatory protein OraA/RecX
MAQNFDKYKIDILDDDTNDTMLESWQYLSPKMLKIQDSIYDSLSLDDLTLTDKAMVASKMVGNWIGTYYGEKRLLDKLKEKRETIIEEQVAKMLAKDKRKPVYKLSDEAEKSAPVRKLDKAIKEQEEVLKFLQEHLYNLKQFGFSIKSATELAKLES